MAAWATFIVVVGGASGALIGLLFVAVSIRIDVIGRSAELRNRAAQTLALFTCVLIFAIVFSLPGQPHSLVGVEVAVLAVLTGVGLQLLDRRAGRSHERQRVASVLDVVTPNMVTCVAFLVGGLLLAGGLLAGAYVMVLAVVFAFVGGLASAWLFLTRVDEPE